MNFEEFQKEWHAVKCEPKSHDELRQMMYASPVWRFRRVTRKEALSFCGKLILVVGVSIIFDLFGAWSTAVFALWSLFILVDDYIGLRYMLLPPPQISLKTTLQNGLRRMERLTFITRFLLALICVVILLIIIAYAFRGGAMDTVRSALIALTVVAVAGTWWSSHAWSAKIAEVKEMLGAFEEKKTSTDL